MDSLKRNEVITISIIKCFDPQQNSWRKDFERQSENKIYKLEEISAIIGFNEK